MKLSIVIPVYNEENYIDAVIARVLAVPFPKEVTLELIAVDDCSRDATPEKLKRWEEKGIVSGTTTAVIVVRLQAAFSLPESVLLSVAVTALVSGLTIGGKALGKTVALNKSTSVVYWVGRFLHLFHR